MKCVSCNEYELSLKDKRVLTPKSNQFVPAAFKCPVCGQELASTEVSRFLCVLSILGTVLSSSIFFAEVFSLEPLLGTLLALVCSIFINEYVFWPAIIRLKKWETLSDALPKSRLKGYTYFLLIPITLMILLFYIAISL